MSLESRRVIHIDCDCFFAAVEMRDNPPLRFVPLAIGGDPSGRGVISTCNYVARRYGVHSAMPSARALSLCPQLTLMRGDMSKYREVSRQIMAILARHARVMEQVSIDEAYIEPLGNPERAREVAEAIRAAVAAEVGVTVSAGIGPNKFIAKVASDWNKPDGLFEVTAEQLDAFVAALDVAKIPGVGPAMQQKLAQDGIQRCEDLRQIGRNHLVHRYGRMGVMLAQRCQGQDERPLRISRERKSVSVERTFQTDIEGEQGCLQQLPGLWQRWNERIDAAGWQHQRLIPFVKVKFADFSQTTLADVEVAADYQGFEQLMRQAIRRQHKAVRLMGIGARINPANPGQGDLFGSL